MITASGARSPSEPDITRRKPDETPCNLAASTRTNARIIIGRVRLLKAKLSLYRFFRAN